MQGYVYLLHLERPLGDLANSRGQASHYTGWALDWRARLAEHRAGRGAALTRAAVEQGISFDVVQVWAGDRSFERRVKQLKAAPRLCPVCGVKHPRGPRCLSYVQLALQLEAPAADEWPLPTREPRIDWFEISYYRRRPAVRFDLGDMSALGDGDIPW